MTRTPRIEVEPLRPGDRVAVVAPGFAPRPAAVRAGVDVLRSRGYHVSVGRSVARRVGYFAGSDEERASDLVAALADPDVRAVWFARGGYGTSRILRHLEERLASYPPTWLVGYSDVTALFALAVRTGRHPCVHGPVVTELADSTAWHRPSLDAALARRAWTQGLRSDQVLVAGRASGALVGGNLTVLAHGLGTPFAVATRDRVLAIEDVGEPTYAIDRALAHLDAAGALEGVRGVLVGGLRSVKRSGYPPDRRVRDVLRDWLSPLGVPVVDRLPFGHVPRKRALPLGARVTIDTDDRRITFGE